MCEKTWGYFVWTLLDKLFEVLVKKSLTEIHNSQTPTEIYRALIDLPNMILNIQPEEHRTKFPEKLSDKEEPRDSPGNLLDESFGGCNEVEGWISKGVSEEFWRSRQRSPDILLKDSHSFFLGNLWNNSILSLERISVGMGTYTEVGRGAHDKRRNSCKYFGNSRKIL